MDAAFLAHAEEFVKVESAIGARRIRSILTSGMCSLTTFLHALFGYDDGSEQPWPRAAQNRRQNHRAAQNRAVVKTKKIMEESSQRAHDCERSLFTFPRKVHMLVEIWSEGAISLGPRSRTQPEFICSHLDARGLADGRVEAPLLLLAAGSGTKARVQRKAK